MPSIFEQPQIQSLHGVSRECIQLAQMLEKLPADARKEILPEYGIHEQEGLVAPSQEPQDVKKTV